MAQYQKWTKFKVYLASESGERKQQLLDKEELVKHQIDGKESLFELAERYAHRLNRNVDDAYEKLYCYKLEKVEVTVMGYEDFYGLGISEDDTKPEFN